MNATVDRRALARELARAALLHGTFKLRSGRVSKYYLDKYLFTTQPRILAELGRLFAQRVASLQDELGVKIDRLAGAELGGIPLVTVASLEAGLPAVFVRNAKKDYGTSKQVEGALAAGEKIVMVEDVATTGGQALEAVSVLRGLGADVVCVIATIDRQEGAGQNMRAAGVRFEALFTKADLGIDE